MSALSQDRKPPRAPLARTCALHEGSRRRIVAASWAAHRAKETAAMHRYRLFVPTAVAFVFTAVLAAGTPRTAGALETIHLLSGASGIPCAPDPNVSPAYVGTGAPGDPCHVQDDLGQPGKSRCVTTNNSSDVSATFAIEFSLPGLFFNPSLDLLVKVDDVGQVFLNGHLISGTLCDHTQLVYSAQTTNAALFQPGTNVLTFQIVNNPVDCTLTPTARSGPDDGMNLQFEGSVTFNKPPAGGGINLGWDDCGGQPPSLNKTFACDTNAGFNTLIGSFRAPSFVTEMSANEVVMDVQTSSVTLASWWNMRTGGCRAAGSLLGVFDFTAGPFTCYDYWQGGAIGTLSESPPVGNRVRIRGVFALPAGDGRITGILEGTEVYSFKANINHSKTVGLGSCAGCANGACIVLNSIKLNQPVDAPGGGKYLGNPANRAYALWQGGIGGDCYAATPAKNVTWGQIKAHYR
jgi:hypothetical protein